MDYRKKLIVAPGSKVKLADIDPAFHGKHETHEAAFGELQEQVVRLTHLQYLLYAEKKHALLIVPKGIDAAGTHGIRVKMVTGDNITIASETTRQRG
jgi:polyphosphate kinase 2 (PPK2 family)